MSEISTNTDFSTFEREYITTIKDQLRTLKQAPLTPNEESAIEKRFLEARANVDDSKLDKVLITDNGPNQAPIEVSPLKIANFAYSDNKPIMSMYGTFFKQHKDSNNYPAEMVKHLGDTRSAEKKLMNQYSEDSLEYEQHDGNQKVFKVLGNSWYGVLGQASFIFYNKLLGPSVTYAGVAIITSAVLGMEAWLGNNVKFLCYHDIVTFVNNTLSESYPFEILDYLDADKVKSAKDVWSYIVADLSDFSITKKEEAFLFKIFKKMSLSDLNKLYYKRNMVKFMENSKIINSIVGSIPKEGDLFTDPNEPLDYTKEKLDNIYEVLLHAVGYRYAYHDRYNRALTMDRKSVLVIDTDSTFLHLYELFMKVCETAGFSEDKQKEIETIVNVCNTITYFCSLYMQEVLDVHTSNINIPVDKQPLINMKSELSRISYKAHYKSL